MKLIPAIGLIEGKCVRLTEGRFDEKEVFHDDPVAMARAFEDHGLEYLHLVDLDGAKNGAVQHWKILEQIAQKTGLKIDFSGGIKTAADVQRVLDAGAAMAGIGSLAAREPERFYAMLERFGPGQLVLAADVRDGKVAVSGWQEQTELEIESYLRKHVSRGLSYALCTDISRDGKMAGPSLDLYKQLCQAVPQLKLWASGGVRSLEDLEKIRQLGMDGAIIGKAIYTGAISLQELASIK
jgi:phosphoribosylformimino-5-aminoimidazole carboxamide ribotide isomerase